MHCISIREFLSKADTKYMVQKQRLIQTAKLLLKNSYLTQEISRNLGYQDNSTIETHHLKYTERYNSASFIAIFYKCRTEKNFHTSYP